MTNNHQYFLDNTDMVETLVKNGADLNLRNKLGETAFDIARRNYMGDITTKRLIENYLRPPSNETVH